MARYRINPEWQKRLHLAINNLERIDEVVGWAPGAKWLVASLAKKNIGFRVHNLGAGVKRITTETDLCPKCHGSGRC